MRILLQLISGVALIGTALPPVLFLTGTITLEQTKITMLVATIGWFISSPLWMGRPQVKDELVI